MKQVLAAVIYTGVALMANPGFADTAALEALRDGDMKKLVFHAEPTPLPDLELVDAHDAPVRLADMRGEWLVVNFWATWCAPCRKEMPTLSNLQTALEGQPVRVVTIATGRNDPAAIRRFFDDIGVENLTDLRDPKQALARQMGILGLPITVILDPEGQEIARLRGDAHWDSDSAIEILKTLASGT